MTIVAPELGRPLYLRPDYMEQAKVRGYNQAQVALLQEFAERGYAVIDLDRADIDAIAAEITEKLEPSYDHHGRLQDAWKQNGGVRALAVDAQILEILEMLYGREAFPFQTLNFNKGTEQETHSDTIHFDSAPKGYMAGVWVALEDIDANNGPLHYYPGSHKLEQLTLADIGIRGSDRIQDAYVKYYEPMIADYVRKHGLQKEEGYIRKGQAIIWSANLLHGGSPIREKGRSRHSQVTHYYFKDCTYYTPLLSDPLLGRTQHREPFDIRTGLTQAGSYAGGKAPPATGSLIKRAVRWLDTQIEA